MKLMYKILVGLLLSFIVSQVAFAQTTRFYVKPTASGSGNGSSWANATSDLQAAINASGVTEVWVAAGTYKPTLDPQGNVPTAEWLRAKTFLLKNGIPVYGGFAGTETTLRQRNISTNITTLSGDIGTVGDSTDNCYRVVTSVSDNNSTILDGFTITGGNANNAAGNYYTVEGFTIYLNSGAGAMLVASNAIMRNLTFSSNATSTYGGGLYVGNNSLASIISCNFNNNTANSFGGGAYNASSSNTLYNNCTFTSNTSPHGGGMANHISGVVIQNCTFLNNVTGAAGYGAGIYNSQSAPRIEKTVFKGNSAGYGGANYNYQSNATYISCFFISNVATTGGGGIYQTVTSIAPTFNNCVFANNSANQGGAILCDRGDLNLNHCTFYGNTATLSGGGGSLSMHSSVNYNLYINMNNCLFSNSTGGELDFYGGGAGSFLVGSYNWTQAPYTSVINNTNKYPNNYSGGQPGYTNSLDLDGADNQFGTRDDGLIPLSNDFSVNKCPLILTEDITGLARETWSDMGAYESTCLFSSPAIFVKPVASGLGDGSTWANATSDLQAAINNACGKNVWVAAGTYKPIKDLTGNINPSDNREKAFVLKNGIAVYGGFAGNESSVDQRNVVTNPTILSGDIGTTGVSTDNAYHVVVSIGDENSTLLDGFTITGGNANGSGQTTVDGYYVWKDQGGGIYCVVSSPRFNNLKVNNNYGFYGGGITNNSSCATFISNSTVSNNTASYGAGIYSSYSSTPSIAAVSFVSNTANVNGGGLYNYSAGATVNQCVFSGNTAVENGGGIHNIDVVSTITNSIFTGNTANYGGAVKNSNSASTFTNCTFYNNSATTTGGGFHNSSSAAILKNSIIWGNTGSGTQGIANETSTPTVTYSIVQGGYTGVGNSSSDPLFNNISAPIGTDNIWRTSDDGLYLQSSSPAINTGINTGAPTTDITGYARSGNPDMGAYEYNTACAGSNGLVVFVKPTASGLGNGSSWANATNNLDAAINNACGATQVWVAAGTYKPTQDVSGHNPADSRDKAFFMKDNIKVYGGFAGNETSLEQRNIAANVTILSGDIGTPNDNSDNCYHVVIASDITTNALLDGFLITKGNANGSGAGKVSNMYGGVSAPRSYGGGVLLYNTGFSINYCNIYDNFAEDGGGGMYSSTSTYFLTNSIVSYNAARNTSISKGGGVLNSFSVFTIYKTVFDNNTCERRVNSQTFNGEGGGLYNIQGNNTGLIEYSTFSNNQAADGAGVYTQGNLTFTGCLFTNNIASREGGGLHNDANNSTTYLYSCVFYDNRARTPNFYGRGGGAYNEGNLFVNSCTFYYNSTYNYGGGIFTSGTCNIDNTIIYGSLDDIHIGTTPYSSDIFGSPFNIKYSLIGDARGLSGSYSSFLGYSPEFVNVANPAGADGIWGTDDDGLRLPRTSALINRFNEGGPAVDFKGVKRISYPDMGAYESTADLSTAVLDNIDLPTSINSTAAFSLRKLSSTYTGYAIRVRRSSDNTTQDIGFAENNLDTVALKTFVGGNNGFVTIWYDQSGNGNHATNSNAAAQPSIVTSGTINRTAGLGQPVVTTTTTSQSLSFEVLPSISGSNLTVNAVAYMQNTTGINARLVSLSNGSSSDDWNNNSYVGAIIGNSTANNVRADRDYPATLNSKGFASFASNTPGVITSLFNGTNHQIIVNGSGGTAVASSGAFGITFGRLFNHSNDAGPSGWAGGAWEIILFPSALNTTDRQAVENNQLAFYNITNANLSAVSLSNGTLSPSFATNTTAYTSTVSNAISSTTVTPTLEIAGAIAQVRVNGGSYATVNSGAASAALSLNVGGNTIDVRVTALDGTTVKTYTITTTRIAAPLDNVGLSASTPAASAYSLRKLSSSYSGSAIQVRRSSDNTTTDIGFAVNGDLDTTALKTFVGANNGFVTIWYDQSGHVRHLTEPTTSRQPNIINAGLLRKRSGKVTIYFDAADDGMIYSGANYLTTTPISVNLVAGSNSSSSASRRALQGVSPNNWLLGPHSNTHAWYANGWNHQTTPWSNTLVERFTIIEPSSGACSSYRNGTSITTNNNYGTPGTLNLGYEGIYQEFLDGYISEVISFTSVLSITDLSNIESNQSAYYRLATVATLSALSTSSSSLSPTFAAATTSYTASVSNSTSSITVTPTLTDANATVQVNINGGGYTNVTSGSASSALSLNIGSNTIAVRVTAQDGTTVTTYTITITRSAAYLDNVGLSSSNPSPAAFSLRKLSSTYTGNAIQVRRSSDNATSDIGFTANGDLDTAALKTFVGANNGFVTIWYDQSGNARNATQATTGSQPQIVTNGVIYRKNNQPTIYFNSTSLATPSFIGYSNAFTLSIVAGVQNNTTYSTFGGKTNSGAAAPLDFWGTRFYYGNGSYYYWANLSNGIDASSGFSQWVFSADSNGSSAFRNKAYNGGYLPTTLSDENNALYLGSRDDGATSLDGWISEYVTLSLAINTTDRQSVESNQFTYYNFTNANLSAINVSNGTLSPSFAANTTAYTATVTNVSSITVTPTLEIAGATAQVRVNGGSYATVASGAASAALSLNIGSNTVDITVTALDGTTIKSYTLTVTRSVAALDNVGLSASTPAASAYSLRKLSSSYSGSAIQVRRSSDNTTTDIGFTTNGNLDTAALKTFVGANNGFVTIWYDQSGNARNATQATNGSQPQIVNAGVINKSGNLPSMLFNGSGTYLRATLSALNASTDHTLNTVAAASTGNIVALSSSSGVNENSCLGAAFSSSGSAWFGGFGQDANYIAGTNTSNISIRSKVYASNTINGYFNGSSIFNTSVTYNLSTADVMIGVQNNGSNQFLNGAASEVLVFTTSLSSVDRQTVENNQLAYYNINNANLSAINVSNGTLSPSFAANTTAYTATVTNVSSITVTPTLEISGATAQVRVNGGSYATVASGAASAALSLNIGSNTVDITVTALDGTTVKTYTLTVTRSATSLDNVGLSASNPSTAAFSLRKLSSTYTGNAIQVRRSSDNTLQDIGFTANGNLDTAALKTFVGANNGFVRIWYDQSGNGNNAANGTADAQPSIVTSGIVNRIAGLGQPVVTTTTTSQILNFAVSPSITGSNLTANAVAYMQNTTGIHARLVSFSNGSSSDDWNNNSYVGAIIGNSTANQVRADRDFFATSNSKGLAAFASSTPGVITSLFNGTNHQMFVNGSGGTAVASSGAFGITFGRLFNHASDASPAGWAGGAWEIIVFPSAFSTTDRQTIENNQLAYYNITNANLSATGISNGTLSPSFANSTTAYTATIVANSVTVTPTLEISGATAQVRVNGGSYATVASGAASNALNLNFGSNTVDVRVTALDGTTVKTYTITITRNASTLDNVGLGASNPSPAAFSLRKLSSTYSGSAIQVRRSNDNATSNIGFTANGDLDTAALKTFVGANNGFVSVWYDQSGNGRNATQSTNGSQPQIVSSGSVNRRNGIPTVSFSNQKLATAAFTGYQSALSFTLAIVGGVSSDIGYQSFGGKTLGNYAQSWDIWGSNFYVGDGGAGSGGPVTLTKGLTAATGFSQWSFTGNTSTRAAYINGTANGSGSVTYYGDGGAALILGSRADAATQLNGWISEYVTTGSVLNTTDRQSLENNQLAYYNFTNANLSAINLSNGTLNPSFTANTTAYTATVSNAISSITVTPTVEIAGATAQVRVNGGSYATVASGAASSALSLNVGSNTVDITVTAQDGTTIKNYTITVTRGPITWMGGTSTDFSNPANWSGGAVPTVVNDFVVATSANNPIITGTHAVNNFTINSGANLTVTGTIRIAGDIINNGSITATSGTVELNGSSAQSIPANTFTSNRVQNLTINNSAGVSLGGALTVTGVLTPTAGVLNTGGNLILASTATGTASIAAGSGTYITGNVTMQRYTRAQRGYRTFGHPFSTAQNLGILTDNFRITGLTTNAGSGTYATSAGNPSAFVYDPTQVAGSTSVLTRLTDATANIWERGKGLYVFVRGAGNEGAGGTGASNYSGGHNPLTLDGTGAINQGDVTVNLGYGGIGRDNYNLIGNPYPCPINLKTVTNIGSYGTVYVYNPIKNTAGADQYTLSGGFDQYTNNGSNNIIVPAFGAFYIQATGNGQSLTFKESDKAVGGSPNFTVFGTSKQPLIRLAVANAKGTIDDVSFGINSSSTDASTDKYDATKLGNSLFNFYSLASDKKWLAIDYRANLNNMVPLGIQTSLNNTYTITLSELTDLPNTQVVLRDKLLNKETILSQVGDSYSFAITADTATKGENRFEIGLLGTTVLPVQIADITAQLQTNKTVAVNWTSTTEVNLASYNVQRSKDGSNFSTVGTVAAKGASAYSYSDDLNNAGILPATIYYRLEALDKDGSKTYSKVVAVALGSSVAKAAINIYPNPVQSTLFAQVTVTKAGAAQLKVVDAQGKIVATQKTQLAVGTTSISIPAAQLAAGSYVLEIETTDGKQQQRFVKE